MTHAGLIGAAGALRDGIAAIENLGQLLRSRRVGPRSLSGGLPDLQAGAAVLAGRIEAFSSAAAAELSSETEARAALERVCMQASARLAELQRAIAAADPRTARGRLAMEASVQAMQNGLSELLVLADLLAAASSPRAVTLALADALSVRWPDPREGDARHEVRIARDAPITADPAVLGPLIEMALGIVATTPSAIELTVSRDGRVVRLGLRRAEGSAATAPRLRAPVGTWSADAVRVATGAARAAGIAVEIEDSEIALVVPSG